MALRKGDFILVNYTANVKETGEVFDTTLEDTAKSEGLYKEGANYEPILVVIGEGWVLKMLDESLPSIEIGKATAVEIPPEKAFGDRDPDKVKRISLRNLVARGTTPTLGMRIEYNGRMATVRSMGSGRVLLDFNPPLAGKTLVYNVAIEKKLTRVKEKFLSLIHRRLPVIESTKFNLMSKGKTVRIEMPEEAFYLEGVQVAKRGIAFDIQKFFPKKTTVTFTETFAFEPKTKTETGA